MCRTVSIRSLYLAMTSREHCSLYAHDSINLIYGCVTSGYCDLTRQTTLYNMQIEDAVLT